MNKIKIDLPEKFQQNAFAIWMEGEGFELFQAYYAKMMPEERQPENIYVEFDIEPPLNFHYITIE